MKYFVTENGAQTQVANVEGFEDDILTWTDF